MQMGGFLVYFSACIGHIAILSCSLNWWYGTSLPHRLLFCLRMLHGLTVLAGFLAFWPWLRAGSLVGQDSFTRDRWYLIRDGYTLGCAAVGIGVVPSITLVRSLRRRPTVLLSNHTQTLNVAERLGYKPIGRGKHRRLACLPFNEVFQVDLAERTLRLSRLPPAWDGLTVLHLSDLHLCGTPDKEFYQRVMDVCRDWEPDILAITGDIVDSKRHHRWILPVLGRLRWRVAAYAIFGNHDHRFDTTLQERRLQRLGIRVLGNSWEMVEVRGEPLIVIGQEVPWGKPAPDLRGCPQGPFRLCLSHTPDRIHWARQHRIDLMLAGHVHGGQIRFPVIGSVLVPSLYGRRYDCGTFCEPPTIMHVSRGLAGQHPLRYNCRPEVTKLVLRASTGQTPA